MTPRPDMADREVLGLVRERLLAQGGPSAGPMPGVLHTCLYRGPAGRRCAVGCLIDDSEYRPEFEGMTLWSGDVWAALVRSGVPDRPGTRRMLRAAQFAHDARVVAPHVRSPVDWESLPRALDAIASYVDHSGAYMGPEWDAAWAC